MHPTEPSLTLLESPSALRYFLATRPMFLLTTLIGTLIGIAAAFASGVALRADTVMVTIACALLANAGINVLNDYFDARNGTDEANSDRIYPFTGGSRFIQNGVMSLREMLFFGTALMALTAAGGLWLAWASGPGLLLIGAAGLLIGWGYSAPPVQFNHRGLGEACVFAGFVLITLGADFVQRAAFAAAPLVAAVGFALLVTNVLYINQFPDRAADALAGKRHWVVRLGPQRARWGYPLLAGMAYLWVAGSVAAGALPGLALLSLAPAVLSARAARILLGAAARPAALAPALPMTVAAALSHGALLALAVAGHH